MPVLEALLSGCGVAIAALLSTLSCRDARTLAQGRVLAALAGSVCAQLLADSPVAPLLPTWLRLAVGVVGALNVGLLWWFCLVLLRDDFRPALREWAGLVALAAVPMSYTLANAGLTVPRLDLISALGSLPPVAMVLSVLLMVVRDRSADLVEPRRRARRWLAFALLFALVVSLTTEELADARLISVLRNALIVLPLGVATLLWLVRLQAERLQFLPTAAVTVTASTMDPHDIALHRRLVDALDRQHCYLQPELTIDALAEQLRAPVHQVRTLINSGMGHRNFPAFVNTYRVAHARRLLAEPERARDTVLSVALQSGFASLATFNRVFRDLTGTTPTAFRADALARQLPDLRPEPRDS